MIDTDSLPADPLEALRALRHADGVLDRLRRDRVEMARRQGATWDQIGASLGVTRQSAWEFYGRETRADLDDTSGPDLDEDTAMRLATEEVDRVRRRRRPSEH